MRKTHAAWRNIRKNRGFSLLNILGLSLGITCFLLLGAYVIHERSYDRFHPNAARIAYISYGYQATGEPEFSYSPMSPTAVAPMLKENFAEVEKAVRIYAYNQEGLVQHATEKIREAGFKYADQDFFDVIAYPFLAGDVQTALQEPFQIVLTQAMAEKYFPGNKALDQFLNIDGQPWKVVGIIPNPPTYTELSFTAILSNKSLKRYQEPKWNSANDLTLVLLKDSKDFKSLQEKANASLQKMFSSELQDGKNFEIYVEQLADVHLHSAAGSGNLRYLYIFSALALSIIAMACINFVNLSLARANERAKEVGVRKMLGASRLSVFQAFLIECSLMVIIALLIAIVLSYFLLPAFAAYIGTALSLSLKTSSLFYLGTLTFAMGLAILAGSWPAYLISSFKLSQAQKGKTNLSNKGFTLGNILLVVQFSLSSIFIICTLVTSRQLHYIQTTNTGLARSQIVVLNGRAFSDADRTTLKNKLLSHAEISAVSASYDSPVNIQGGYSLQSAEGKPADFGMSVTAIPIEKDFASLFEIPILAGAPLTDLDIQRARDTTAAKEQSFMVNERLLAALGWTAAEAIGKHIDLNGREGRIKTVLKDFNFNSLKEEIKPVVLFPEYYYFGNIFVKIAAGSAIQTSLDKIEQDWKLVKPQSSFAYHFLDDDYARLYQYEQQTSRSMLLFSFISIGISCMGLLSLAAFQAQQRVKEIGIRKVLGASVGRLILLLSAHFIKLALLAFLIGAPIAGWLMQNWLEQFAFRDQLHWGIFAIAALLSIGITLLTISGQALRAARANPINSLRDE